MIRRPFRRFPTLAGSPPLAIAHRGGALEAPENSWAAFDHAYRLGFRYIETDVRATSDGVAVAFHDPVVERVSTTAGRIRDLSWAELSRARIHTYEPVVPMAELLERYPDAVFNIDVKEAAAIAAFVRMIRQQRAHERVVLASFSHRRLTAVRAELGFRSPSSLSPREVMAVLRRARTGRGSPDLPPGAVCMQVPPMIGSRVVVDESLLRAAHELGLQVHVWTVNEPDHMRQLLDLGVDGIMTDRPSLLRDVLRARGSWPIDY